MEAKTAIALLRTVNTNEYKYTLFRTQASKAIESAEGKNHSSRQTTQNILVFLQKKHFRIHEGVIMHIAMLDLLIYA